MTSDMSDSVTLSEKAAAAATEALAAFLALLAAGCFYICIYPAMWMHNKVTNPKPKGPHEH